jgi:hypothetical protein
MVYNAASFFLSALIYGTVYGDGDDGDKMDSSKRLWFVIQSCKTASAYVK